MTMIYTPRGKAREYSPLALNLYLGCTHACKYCYAPGCMQKTREAYYAKPAPRSKVIEGLKKELSKQVPKEQILMSFIGDPYTDATDDNSITREALEILADSHAPVAILTKAGKKCLKDLDVFKRFGEHIQIGATLTFDNEKDSLEWEPGAALPEDRLETLRILHENGVRTFASFEPVIIPAQSLSLMSDGLDYIDVYKIGKINNYGGIDKKIDWTKFLNETVDLLRGAGKQFYIKHDLRLAAPSIRLYGNEVLQDEHNAQ